MHSDLHCTALRDATWKWVLGTNRSRGQQSFGFGVQQDEDSSSPGVLHEPRISRLERRNHFSPIPIACSSPRQTSVCKTFGFPRTRISSANWPGSLFAEFRSLVIAALFPPFMLRSFLLPGPPIPG